LFQALENQQVVSEQKLVFGLWKEEEQGRVEILAAKTLAGEFIARTEEEIARLPHKGKRIHAEKIKRNILCPRGERKNPRKKPWWLLERFDYLFAEEARVMRTFDYPFAKEMRVF
jgi:hypothetical protein